MWMTNVINSILGLYIILVLVLVFPVLKKNSAFGHARNKGAINRNSCKSVTRPGTRAFSLSSPPERPRF